MEIISKLKGCAKRGLSVLCAAVMVLTSGILVGTETVSAANATLNGSVYLNEALNKASGGQYREDLATWQAFLDKESKTTDYIGTPYSSWLYAASPNVEKWQYENSYHKKMIISNGGTETGGGTNCTGFVWHIISNSLAAGSGKTIEETGTWVPNSNGFNAQGFSRSSWSYNGSGRWYTFLQNYGVHYYEFSSKSEMLNSGVLQKGDIIWCVDGSVGTGYSGLSQPASNHHIGIYMGNGTSDDWWQSGPTVENNGNVKIEDEANSINGIFGKASSNTYVVIPWAEKNTYTQPTLDPTYLRIQKVDAETSKATAQGNASLAGALFTFKYYSDVNATTPTKTWVLRTNEKGYCYLDSAYLNSGDALYTASSGDAYLPLGKVTIQETLAPSGYCKNSQITTLYIEDHDKSGKATIRVDGTTDYLQEYTVTTEESIVRGNMFMTKVAENQPLSYIPFILTNNDTGDTHWLMTDENGNLTTVIDTSVGGEECADYVNTLDWTALTSSTINSKGEIELDGNAMVDLFAIFNSRYSGVWFGDGKVNSADGSLVCGSYTLQEVRCPKNQGYQLITRNFTVTSSYMVHQLGEVIDTQTPGTITGKKVNENGEGLSGAVLGLFPKDATEFTYETTYSGMTTTSGEDGTFQFENVPKGNYLVHEIEPPEGYILSDKSYEVTVKVNTAGEEVAIGEDIVNYPTEVEFTKVDEDGNALSGAKMQIFDGTSGFPISTWTTDSSSHVETGKLTVGKTYIYYETSAPAGYVQAEKIYFTLNEKGEPTDLDGNPITLEMVDTKTVVEIAKYDESEKLLAGAVLQILDAEGNVVDQWTSTTSPHVLTGVLTAGATYTLHEVSAPTGYFVEDDINFVVSNDGTASVGMVDTATSASIQKLGSDSNLVDGAKLQVLDTDGNVVEEWTTSLEESKHIITAVLQPDTTYILHEAYAPAGYFAAEDIEFQVTTAGMVVNGKTVRYIKMTDEVQAKLYFGKISDIQEQPESGEIIWLPGAVLQFRDENEVVKEGGEQAAEEPPLQKDDNCLSL